ncbi:hypothetical protein FRC09_013280 [Ceratobasidium sp. 395]|nr:hypothetical protein FRC09_013280 [Ceratobasidium sp. 395]
MDYVHPRFVIESSKSLQPDPVETSAQTLSTISQTLLAMANAQSGAPFNFTPLAPTTFVAPTSAVCINALWYLSLSLSVGVSLVALLGKDWARAYMAELTGQPYQQARRRQQRWDSLEKWRMRQVIMFLPVVLHLALLLFAIGLTIYLWCLHLGAAVPVLVVTLVATGVYAVSTALPLAHKNCPYSTPLTQLLPLLVKHSRELPFTLKLSTSELIRILETYTSRILACLSFYYRQVMACMRLQPQLSYSEALDLEAPEVENFLVSEHENSRIDEDHLVDNLTSRAIAWLLENYEDTKSADIALQALAGASARLPMQPLVKCDAKTLLLQRLDACYATRQKTGKRYLKNANLLESATLYSRASAAVHIGTKSFYKHDDRLCWDYSISYGLAETPLCLVNRCLKPSSWSPNKAAFALASWAFIELDDRFPTTTWTARAIGLLDSHCDDSGALNSEALLTLLKSVSYVLATGGFDNTSLLIALVRLLVSLRADSPTVPQVGVALISLQFLPPNPTPNWPFNSSLHLDPELESQRSRYKLLLDAVMKRPELIPSGFPRLGLLELLKHLPQTRERSDLASIDDALQRYSCTPESLNIQGLFIAKSDYNSRYFADIVIPRVEPANDGSFTDSELVRATYLSVISQAFLNTLTDDERIEALRLGVANLETATTNRLKRSCCNLLHGFVQCDFFFENGDWRRGKSVAPLLSLFPLFPFFPLLNVTESTDERVLPYAMQTLWKLTDLIGSSSLPAEHKQIILDPVLSHAPFASARSKADNDLCNSPELAKDMGYAEVWLSRLENIQGEVLQHVIESHIWRTINPDVWGDSDHSNPELDLVRGRAAALFLRCYSEWAAPSNRPLWPLDDGLSSVSKWNVI